MKIFKLTKFVAIFTSSIVSLAAAANPPEQATADTAPTCLNYDKSTGCPPCHTKVISSSGEGTCVYTGSFVANGLMDYNSWAFDFKLPNSGAGCGPCGGGTSASETSLHSVSLKRYFKSRFDKSGTGSFGRTSALAGYDVSMRWNTLYSNDYMNYFEAGNFNANAELGYAGSRGAWAPREENDAHFGFIGYDVIGNPLTAVNDRPLTHTGTYLKADGSSVHFEIIRSGDMSYGRPIAFADRNGNLTTVEYVNAQPAFGTNVPVISEYFRRTKITDPYGRELLFEYSLNGSQYLVSKITHPDGKFTTYNYTNLVYNGWNLSSVNHPDLTTTTHNWVRNTTTGLWEVSMFEAAADAGKRRKTVYISAKAGLTSTGAWISTSPGLARMILNGTGEMTYANRTLSTGERLLYAGGNKAFIANIQGNTTRGLGAFTPVTNGAALRTAFYSTDEANLIRVNSFTRTNGTNWRQLSATDALGRQSVTPTRAPISLSPTRQDLPDGTSSNVAYNPFDAPATITDRLGRITQNTFDISGNQLSKTRGFGSSDASTETFFFNAQGLVTEHRDALYDANFSKLHNTIFKYDANNYPTKTIHPADLAGGTRPETLYTWDSAGRLDTVTDPLDRVTSFSYDDRSRLLTTTYSDTSTETVTYGTGVDANLVMKTTDRNGIETTYGYDDADRRTLTIRASNTSDPSIEICNYLTGTQLKSSCTINGEQTTYTYDYKNRLLATIRQADTATTLSSESEYDILGRTRSTTDPYGRKTYYLYDQNDRVIKTITETVPDGIKPGAGNVPDIVEGSSQTSAAHNYTLTDLASNTLETDPNSESVTHKVTYTDPRDLFLEGLTRDLTANAKYLITESIYDAAGQRLISTDARGNSSWTQYDELGRATLSIAAVGTPAEVRSETLYDENSNVIESRNPRFFSEGINAGVTFNARDTFTYTGRNLRKSHITAAGSTVEPSQPQSWTYYLDGRSNEHTDFRGNIAKTYWHSCCGRLQASVQRDGTSTSINNTDFYGNTTHTAVVENFTGTGYDYHNPVDVDTLQETTTRFDGRGRPTYTTRWLSPLGTVVDHARVSLADATGIPIAGLDSIPAASGLTTSYTYDDSLTDQLGIDITYATQFTALTARLGYNPFGVGSDGSAVAVTNPEGETSVQVMDGVGRTIMSINPEGHISTMEYDQVVTAANIASPSVDVTIPGSLLATSATDANGNTSTSYSDAAGRTIASEDAEYNISVVAYDANSNAVSTRDPNARGTDCTFDALNRDTSCADLQEQNQLVSRSKVYNAASQVVSSTNAEGHITSNVFDERGRLTSTTDPNLITVEYEYDDNNNLISLTDGNLKQRQWIYNNRNLKYKKINPGAGDVLEYTYDALGRLDIKTDQLNDTCTMVYDLAGRMTSKKYKTNGATPESTDTFTYDGASRLISSYKGRYDVTTTHSYADDSMPVSEGLTSDSRTFALSRTYDDGNRPLSHKFADNKIQEWGYDDRNLVINLKYDGDQVMAQTHDVGYRLSTQTLGNGLVRNLSYVGRLDNLRKTDTTSAGITAIASLDWSYTYNMDKQVTAETTAGSFLDDSSFIASYDPGDRLKTWDRTGSVAIGARQTEAWIYDNAGNQTTVTRDGTADARAYNADNELLSTDDGNTTRDAKGNMTEDAEGNKYFYDLDNRINEIQMDGGDTIELAYDALGRRVFRKNGSDETAYLWWGDQETSEHKSSAGIATIQNDLWGHPTGLNQICARAVDGDKNDIEYYHKNYLDHVYAVSNDSGNIIEHYRYSAFGEVEIYSPAGVKLAVSAIDNGVMWNSRRFDADTGLYYYKYRHYKSDIGRWLGRDPIEEDGGDNLYGFVGNEPFGRFDRYGLYIVIPWGKYYEYLFGDTATERVIDQAVEKGKKVDGGIDGDYEGRVMLRHYMKGKGVAMEKKNWGDYMMADNTHTRNPKYREKLVGILKKAAKKRQKNMKAGDVEALVWTGHLELNHNEAVTGYSYLHGTNEFTFDGKIKCLSSNEDCGCTAFSYDINYHWVDDINKNKGYWSDAMKNFVAETVTLGKAESYSIEISWNSKATMNTGDVGTIDGGTIDKGWPFYSELEKTERDAN